MIGELRSRDYRMATRGRPRSFDRDEALQSALELFWQRGYDGVTLEDLQNAMGGIKPPSFYAAFGSKEALFVEAMDHYRETIGMKPQRALEEGKTARESIESLMRTSVTVFSMPNAPRGCMMILGSINCTNENLQARLQDGRHEAPNRIRQRLERAVREGDLPAGLDLSAIASFYATVVHGLALRARDGASRRALNAAVDGAMAAWPGLVKVGRSKGRKAGR